MTLKKNKLAFSLLTALFFSLPISQTFAHEHHCDIKETELGNTMKYIKSELRAYNKGFDAEDKAEMKEHAGELVKLTAKAETLIPASIAITNHAEKVEDLTAEQKAKFVQYQEKMSELNATFIALSETTDETEIETLLGQVKEHTKTGHQQFRLDCKK